MHLWLKHAFSALVAEASGYTDLPTLCDAPAYTRSVQAFLSSSSQRGVAAMPLRKYSAGPARFMPSPGEGSASRVVQISTRNNHARSRNFIRSSHYVPLPSRGSSSIACPFMCVKKSMLAALSCHRSSDAASR